MLTTGLRLPRTHLEQAAYVERLRAVGIAALAFGVGVRFTAIPAGVSQRCEETDLPSAGRCRCPTFIAVTQRIAQQLADDQQQALQRAVAFQQALTRRALREGPAGLVGLLARGSAAPWCCSTSTVSRWRCRRGPNRWHGVWLARGRSPTPPVLRNAPT